MVPSGEICNFIQRPVLYSVILLHVLNFNNLALLAIRIRRCDWQFWQQPFMPPPGSCSSEGNNRSVGGPLKSGLSAFGRGLRSAFSFLLFKDSWRVCSISGGTPSGPFFHCTFCQNSMFSWLLEATVSSRLFSGGIMLLTRSSPRFCHLYWSY